MTATYQRDAFYHCFTLDHDTDDAAARYRQLYGAPPEQVLEHDGALRLGPVAKDARRCVIAIDKNTKTCIMVTAKGEQ
jgi:hypothetical protein